MLDKAVWEHLSRELAKANTLVDLSRKILKSILFSKARYEIFTITTLDSFRRTILLSIYHFFDNKYSWSLNSLADLSDAERTKIAELYKGATEYINVRHKEVGHTSKKSKLEDIKRFKWLPDFELEKIESLFKGISIFLNSYGMKRYNEGYTFHYSDPGLSLQCLIEDLGKLKK
jgi:hypothetical protein